MSALTNPDDIDLWRLIVLRRALHLEIIGMKRSRGPSAYSQIKREFGFRGAKCNVLKQLEEKIASIRHEREVKRLKAEYDQIYKSGTEPFEGSG